MIDIKAVLFDLDGVLVDTAKFHYQGWKRLADELDIPFDEKANERLKGVDRRNSLLRLVGHPLPEDEIQKLCDRKNGYYVALISTLTPSDLLPGVPELLDDLDKEGFKKAICSSSKNAKAILEKVGITGRFDAVVDGNDLTRGKPDPQIFLLGAERLKMEPSQCVVVEDAEVGIEAARCAGMLAVGVGNPESLSKANLILSDLKGTSAQTFLKLAQ